jgi:hypothetical protein
MLTTIKRLHRVLVDRLAGTRWLRDRAGPDARWAHYERHAAAWQRASDRHAATRTNAAHRADRWHARARDRHARARDRHASSRQRARDRLAWIAARAKRLAHQRLVSLPPPGPARLPANHVQPTQKGKDAR